ncbi:MAG: protein kinase [Acidobacteriota bacterium]
MKESSELIRSQRFALQERLGSGAMGVVFSAFDHERQENVALKILHASEPSALYRFKKEFRALADVAHRNLVNLYELIAEDEQWFFTMEIVEGCSFFEYVRPHASVGVGDPTADTRVVEPQTGNVFADSRPNGTQDALATATASAEPDAGGMVMGGELDAARLRLALRQLVEGVQALHESGKLHRDLKPSNVMVTDEGRLVILDFGLATELAPDHQSADSGLAGTVAYMAPEQAKSESATVASDWYGVGTILFQALTGRLPFVGSLYDVLVGKQERPAPSPAELATGLPPDLVDLCNRLLAKRPEDRPSGAEILDFFGDETQEITATSIPVIVPEAGLVGRKGPLSELKNAFLSTRKGQATSMHVHGPSGMGKTTLIDSFLESLVRWSDATVLRGRCYEREMVPYKALDGVIDSLSRYLSGLEDRAVMQLLPRRDTHALLRLFPVLQRIRALAGTAPEQESPDLLTLRRRAFEALRQLLSEIAQREPLVLFIDDLQWADADSTALLEDMLRPPDPPPLLLITSFRSEEIEKKAFLQEILARGESRTRRQIKLAALTEGDARELVTTLAPARDLNEPVLQAILKEAEGSPFLVEQLTRFIQINRDALRTGLGLVEMLEERMQQLPDGSRELLLTMAAANRPIDATVAYLAAGLEGDERSLVARLRAAHFVRSSGSAKRIELYHDRIREALATLLGEPEMQHIHRCLAEVLEQRGFDDPEALYQHYLLAGDEDAAAEQAVLAAQKAFAALAFDPAARFYRRALDMAPGQGDTRPELLRGLARSLANAGRSSDSATVYLELAEEAQENVLEAQCRAAEQYLLGGHIDRGLAVARGVLARVGLEMAAGPRRALLSLLFNRLKLRLRGLKFDERGVDEIPRRDLVRIDTCWAISNGLSLVDTVQGSDFQTRHLLLALRAREPYRVARALAMEVSFVAATGALHRARELQEKAMTIARRVDNPHAIGLATMQRGMIGYFSGAWKAAAQDFDEAEGIFNDRCSGVVWEMTISRRFSLSSLMYLGEMAELSRRVPRFLAEARERGNSLLSKMIQSRLNIVWLAADDPSGGLELADEVMASSRPGFTVNRYNALIAQVQADLYSGEPQRARQRLLENRLALKKSLLLRVQLARIETLQLEGRIALALATNGVDARQQLDVAARTVRDIGARGGPWAEALAALLRAGHAAVRRDANACRDRLRQAVQIAEAADMGLYAAAGRRRLGEILGGEEGYDLVDQADSWMREQRIVDPQRMTTMLAPGFP